MSSLTVEAKAKRVNVTEDSLVVDLIDERTITEPIACFPRLLQGKREHRNNWRLVGDGEGIHWLDLDEDISVRNLLAGEPSGESQASLRRWLDAYGRS